MKKMDWKDLYTHRLYITLDGNRLARAASQPASDDDTTIAWTPGRFLAVGRGGIVFTGRPGKEIGGGIVLRSPDFASITITAMDGKDLALSKRILVSACGRCENTDMVFSKNRRSVGKNWGLSPVQIEPVTADVSLPPDDWRCQALGPDCLPSADVSVAKKGNFSLLQLSPQYKTMWYLLTRK
ncbi:MAG: hypothetical protein EHM48_00200 [Planctomycetaceae bacterium]|nr:MAG: hypothetical protein EHM48_00200 [Planctomycetaceae bacterium]